MKNILLPLLLLSFITEIKAQCNRIETISVCDMTVVDGLPIGAPDGNPDGVINLFTAYNNQPGVTPIDATMGTWFDPNYNFALDNASGNLRLWDLDRSSRAETDHQFHFLSTTSGCPGDILVRLNVIIGPFSGNALPPNDNNVNLQVCDVGSTPRNLCGKIEDIDLFKALDPIPSPHLNGRWVYVSGGSGFRSLNGSILSVTIPYRPGMGLIDRQIFKFTYIVDGMDPCISGPYPADARTDVSVSVVRKPFSGYPKSRRICEDVIKGGSYDANINLRDDAFLALEDLEGTWTGDTYGQVTNPLDSEINIKEIYDQIIARDGVRFGCAQADYQYTVRRRSAVCGDTTSTVSFKIYEALRPFSQQTATPFEFCEDDPVGPSSVNLYDQLEFTTEAGTLFDYNADSCTSWNYISGPTDLGLITNDAANPCSPPGAYSHLGRVHLKDADPGTYVFEYVVYPQFNCNPDSFQVLDYSGNACDPTSDETGFCGVQRARVTLVIHPKNYAGDDTELFFCETDPALSGGVINLFDFLEDNGLETIYQGPLGEWVDLSTGNVVSNFVTIPTINDSERLSYEYRTVTAIPPPDGCTDSARLIMLIYEEYQPGMDDDIDVCDNNAVFNLFDRLPGSPNDNGTWTGPNGYSTTDHVAMFDPLSSDEGDYTYTVPDNLLGLTGIVVCDGSSATLSVTMYQAPSAGASETFSVCRSDLQIDLEDYLDSTADAGGDFRDLDGTGMLSGSVVDVSQLTEGIYRFQYEIQGHASCNLETAVISIEIIEVDTPTSNNQTFCAIQGATILDLEVNNGMDFNWYDTDTSTNPLPISTVLVNNEDYFVAALDSDGCESERIGIVTTILPLNHPECEPCFKDGVSANEDGQNDEFDLCGLPNAFPNFELNIYNRYGTAVYKGHKNTPLFNGVSNVSLTVGEKLPSAVYFYVFDPKDGMTKPVQGNFYLSR